MLLSPPSHGFCGLGGHSAKWEGCGNTTSAPRSACQEAHCGRSRGPHPAVATQGSGFTSLTKGSACPRQDACFPMLMCQCDSWNPEPHEPCPQEPTQGASHGIARAICDSEHPGPPSRACPYTSLAWGTHPTPIQQSLWLNLRPTPGHHGSRAAWDVRRPCRPGGMMTSDLYALTCAPGHGNWDGAREGRPASSPLSDHAPGRRAVVAEAGPSSCWAPCEEPRDAHPGGPPPPRGDDVRQPEHPEVLREGRSPPPSSHRVADPTNRHGDTQPCAESTWNT